MNAQPPPDQPFDEEPQSDEPFGRARLPKAALPDEEPEPEEDWPLLYHTTYCSRVAAGVDEAAVERIIASSHKNNPEHGITGLLVFGNGLFFQWLEGPREHVQWLMNLLRTDMRHEHMVVFTENEESRERLFPNWDMERVQAEDIREVLQDALESAQDLHNAHSLSVLLHQLETGQLSQLGQA